jgi:hypothetical protein
MSLRLPTPGVTQRLGVAPAGESWLELLNAALVALDAHSHAPGYGRPVPSSGLNVNADLPFGGYNATALRSTRYTDQGSALSAPVDIRCTFVAGGELYYRDAAGNTIKLTSGGALNAATVGGIGGDYATSGASLAYASASQLFSFEAIAGVKAGIAAGPLQLFDPVALGKKVTIGAPSGLAADYAMTLPGALPASTKILTLSSVGAVAAAYDLDGTTLEVAANALRIKDLGVATGKLADLAVTTGKIADLGVTTGKLSDLGVTTGKIADLAVTAAKTDAVSTATPSKLVVRDGSGRAQFAEPSASADAASKSYVDTHVPTMVARVDGATASVSTIRGDSADFTITRVGAGHYRIAHASMTTLRGAVFVSICDTASSITSNVVSAAGSADVYMSDTLDHSFFVTAYAS